MSDPAEPSPSARRLSAIPFDIPAYWTPEEALAVIELLDDLQQRIRAHYDVKLLDLIQTQRRQPGGSYRD